MLSLEMLDVAIGMIFIYLLISLICTAINELAEAKLKLRAVDLEQGIRGLLNNNEELTQKIYNHPFIDGLFRGKYKVSDLRKSNKSINTRYSRGSDLPSYIPAKNFSLALIGTFLPSLENGNSKTIDVAALQKDINGITNASVKEIVSTLAAGGNNDINTIREGIEGWYNSSMDRVSGWYKCRVQKIIFVFGFLLVLFMNADSIAIFNNLVNDRPLRSSIVDAAQRMPATTSADSTSTEKIKANINSLYQLGLPIGWKWKSALNNNKNTVSNLNAIPAFYTKSLKASLWQWFLKVLGWIITAFAISLGAPFWFDVLNKVMVVRSTVKPTEKSPDESSQDRQKS